MNIRIRKAFKGFFVDRQNDRGEWLCWLPIAGPNYTTGMDALLAAREERDLEINRACDKMASDESLEIEI